MIKVFGYLKRKPGLSPQEFADYYEHNHVPLVLSKAFMPMVYKRNYIQSGDAFNMEGNEISFDCMTELVFADRDDLSAWMASLGVDEIARDEENFIDRAATRAYVVDERSSAECHRACFRYQSVDVDATSSAVGLLGAWRAWKIFRGVSDVGRAGLNP